MGTPFKMKGSPFQRNYGISPMKDEEDKRSTSRKVWDKVTQVGMGLKEGLYADSTSRGNNVVSSIKKGYNREKVADENTGKKQGNDLYQVVSCKTFKVETKSNQI